MSDHIDRASDLLWDAIDDKGIEGRLYRQDCHYVAATLDAAGLLATPAHDAAVAAEALREAASHATEDHATDIALGGIGYVQDWLRARADRIEREGGESDA